MCLKIHFGKPDWRQQLIQWRQLLLLPEVIGCVGEGPFGDKTGAFVSQAAGASESMGRCHIVTEIGRKTLAVLSSQVDLDWQSHFCYGQIKKKPVTLSYVSLCCLTSQPYTWLSIWSATRRNFRYWAKGIPTKILFSTSLLKGVLSWVKRWKMWRRVWFGLCQQRRSQLRREGS